MKRSIFLLLAIVSVAGMIAISGCSRVSHGGHLHGHTYVDLGLPSGTLWATCNVGANTPEEYGDYFAWGETTTKSSYTEDNYTYSSDPTTLPSSADAATANWGRGWRMPTATEMQELVNNCTVTWTTQSGVNGRLFTGPNGNSIFLPAAGIRYDGEFDEASFYGCYWSSSFRTDWNGDGSISATTNVRGTLAADSERLFTFASTDRSDILLTELLSFEATCNGSYTELAWSTATECNNDYFIIERSGDAINFTEIARVAGAGNSIEQLDYTYNDYGIHGGDNFYRLVHVDYDGTRTVSEIVVANCEDAYPDYACYLGFSWYGSGVLRRYRYCGSSVRAVCVSQN